MALSLRSPSPLALSHISTAKSWRGTEAHSVGLRTTLNFSGFSQSFDHGFQLVNTPNTGNPLQSADSVLLSSSIPTTRFSVDGIDYTLNLAFGSVTGSGFSEVNQFFVLEGGSASANLIGSITANQPSQCRIGLQQGSEQGAAIRRE